ARDAEKVVRAGTGANCICKDVVPGAYKHELVVEAARFLRQSEFELETRIQVAPGAFREYGFSGNLPKDLRAESGRVLSVWGDAGWGHIVEHDKRSGNFRDELAEAVAAMVRDRWRPQPAPTWVTCVPSLRHPDLLPDLAPRVAGRLEGPFVS